MHVVRPVLFGVGTDAAREESSAAKRGETTTYDSVVLDIHQKDGARQDEESVKNRPRMGGADLV